MWSGVGIALLAALVMLYAGDIHAIFTGAAVLAYGRI